jgi:hypothetical protein
MSETTRYEVRPVGGGTVTSYGERHDAVGHALQAAEDGEQQVVKIESFDEGTVETVVQTVGPSRTQPPPGSWAETAREMARMYPDMDWDAWKDEMKEGGY